MDEKTDHRVIQVGNIAPQATKDQLTSLFSYLGKIEDIRLYPTIRDIVAPVTVRICYVKFLHRDALGMAPFVLNFTKKYI